MIHLNSFELTQSEIKVCDSSAQDNRIVYDFEVEDNHNLFVGDGESFILAHNCLGNPQAVPVLLKALEEPPPRTIWILSSMDPTKFQTDKNGKAILTRAAHFDLTPPSEQSLYKQGVRIIKGERIKCIKPALLKHIVQQCNNEMRTLAIALENMVAFHNGLDAPRLLTIEDTHTILRTANQDITNNANAFLVALYSGKFVQAQLAILEADDHVALVNQCLWGAKFLLNVAVLDGKKHRKVWWTPANRELHSTLQQLKIKPTIGDLGAAVALLTTARSQVMYGNLDDTLTTATFKYMMGEDK